MQTPLFILVHHQVSYLLLTQIPATWGSPKRTGGIKYTRVFIANASPHICAYHQVYFLYLHKYLLHGDLHNEPVVSNTQGYVLQNAPLYRSTSPGVLLYLHTYTHLVHGDLHDEPVNTLPESRVERDVVPGGRGLGRFGVGEPELEGRRSEGALGGGVRGDWGHDDGLGPRYPLLRLHVLERKNKTQTMRQEKREREAHRDR